MKDDEFYELGIQAGFMDWELDDGTTHSFDPRYIRFAKLVAAHTRGQIFKPDWDNYRQGLIDGATAERKACLQIQEDWQYTYANDLVQKIKARGEA